MSMPAVACVAGHVDLAHAAHRQRIDEGARIESEILAADVDVVDVEQQCAAGTRCDRGQEIPFGELRMLEGHVGRDVFDEQLHAEKILRLAPPGARAAPRLPRCKAAAAGR